MIAAEAVGDRIAVELLQTAALQTVGEVVRGDADDGIQIVEDLELAIYEVFRAEGNGKDQQQYFQEKTAPTGTAPSRVK